MPYTKLLSTIFSSQVSSGTNTGTAGGVYKYVNLGGIKILYGTSASTLSLSATNGTNYTIVFPTGFFSRIDYGTVNLSKGNGLGRGAFYNDNPPITTGTALNTASFYLVNYPGSTTSSNEGVAYLFIGS